MKIQKRFISTAFLLLFSITTLFSQTKSIEYDNNWGKAGFTITNTKDSGIELNYSIENFSFVDMNIKGEVLQNIELPGVFLFNDAGMPSLPIESKMIAIPQNAQAKLKIVDFRTEKFQNIEMAPAPIIPLDTDNHIEYQKDEKVFSKDAFFPEVPFQISETQKLRGVDMVMLGITPFQYNPVTKELIVYKDIKLEITYEAGHFGDDRLRSRFWEPILDDALLNYSALPKIDFSKNSIKAKDDEYEYVILTLDDSDFVEWANVIAEYRRQQGISTGVFTLSDVPGGNTVNSIEDWVDNMYYNWNTPPAAILLLADYGTGNSGIISKSYPHPNSGNYITDNRFADVNNDDLPDIAFARITANDASQLEVMITKFIDYENSPPIAEDFYNHPITALGWQTERWFQICSETIGGFWKNNLGKDPVRINALYGGDPETDPWSIATNTNTVLNYFGPNGLNYIPDEPSELDGWEGGNAEAINEAINAGSFMLQHRDHGSEGGWGEPDYTKANIPGLNNTDLSFIMSINCLTGRFEASNECFAEKFHRYTKNGVNSGALGLIAASQVSYSFVNDTYVWGCYDNMWPDFMPGETADPESRFIYPAFANVAGKNFLHQSSWPANFNNKQITYRLFHHHGDPFLNVYSEVPQDLSVFYQNVHLQNEMSMNLTVNEGSSIALTYFDESQQKTIILATAIANSGSTTLTLGTMPAVGTNMLLTITKQNYFRFTQEIEVINPSGSYDVLEGFVINDGGNQEAEYGETFNLDMTLKNIGVSTSENVLATISTEDSYVVSLVNAENVSFSNIEANGSSTSSGQFTVELDNAIPDEHIVEFDLTITDDSGESYQSTFSITVNAPILTIGDLFVDDSASGNDDGYLDAGETADIIIQAKNNGHASIPNVIGNITSTSMDIVINTPTTAPETLNIDQSEEFIFSVTANEEVLLGTPADIQFILSGGTDSQYTVSETKEIEIGFKPVYCEAGANDPAYFFIEQVQFVEIDNTSEQYLGYTDFTDIYTHVFAGESYPITVTNGVDFPGVQMACWVDWNFDGDFEDANEETILDYEYPNGTASISVPENAHLGNTTMRIRLLFNGAVLPCNFTNAGEVEDYSILVLPEGPYVGNISADTSSICGSGSATLSLSFWNGDQLQWQKSSDAANWENIDGANTNPYTMDDISSTMHFRAVVDMNGYDQQLSNEMTITVFESAIANFTSTINLSAASFINNSTNADEYSWNFVDDFGTSSEQNPTYYYSEIGSYTVSLIASNENCPENEFSTEVNITALGINELNSLGIEIYPNPNKGVFEIKTSLSDVKTRITDLSGRVVYEQTISNRKERIDISKYDDGVYMIHFIVGNETYNTLIIKVSDR